MTAPSLRDVTRLAAVIIAGIWLLIARPGEVTVQVPRTVTVHVDWNPNVSGTLSATLAPLPRLPEVRVRGKLDVDGGATVEVSATPTVHVTQD